MPVLVLRNSKGVVVSYFGTSIKVFLIIIKIKLSIKLIFGIARDFESNIKNITTTLSSGYIISTIKGLYCPGLIGRTSTTQSQRLTILCAYGAR